MKETREEEDWGRRIASPTISEALDQFLAEQRARVKSPTYNSYADIAHLFTRCMNGYAHSSLDAEKRELFDHFFGLRGNAHREFCEIFGPAEIVNSISEFLYSFMIRKPVCGRETLKAAATVISKLVQWLETHDYIDSEHAASYAEQARQASKELPAIQELEDLLWQHADDSEEEETEYEETLDDQFTIIRVEQTRLHLEDTKGNTVFLTLPGDITGICRVGWSVALEVGKTEDGWRIIEVGDVYPG
jgi:hypothetical protein